MRYLAFIIAAITSAEMQAYQLAPRLVVSIVVEQLRTDYMDAYAPLYHSGGFKRLLSEGRVYDGAVQPYTPVDRASAIATIYSGTTPYFHGITAEHWLQRSTLRVADCTLADDGSTSPVAMLSSTLGDEIKVGSEGASVVLAFASDRTAAILSAGHAANGAYWIGQNGRWTGSSFYHKTEPAWIKAYDALESTHDTAPEVVNGRVVNMSLQAVSAQAMGKDDNTDLLCVTLSAADNGAKRSGNRRNRMESVYTALDKELERLISGIEAKVGAGQTLFVVTSTGYNDDAGEDMSLYRIPTGTFYINRTASLLNVYLSAIYGQGRYVEACYGSNIYLNRTLVEQKRLSLDEVLGRCREFLLQCAGVADVYTFPRLLAGYPDVQRWRNGYNINRNGDIIMDVTPGWKLQNEEFHQTYSSRAGDIPFPIIFFGSGVVAERIGAPVGTDRIAPTIAKTIRIRAPNACAAQPLF